LPGLGGAIKQHDEDFIVEEKPLYTASGQGTHTYLLIEKRGLSTLAAIQHIARTLGRQPREIGYAGLKDAHGVTRQWLSIEHESTERAAALSLARIKVLDVTRHGNKIKLGHLSGNRFEIKVRDPVESPIGAATAILEVLAARGVPNYFGPQRFGTRADNAAIGLAVLHGDFAEAIALMAGRPGPLDHGLARRARELFDGGDFEAASRTWPRGAFAQQSRICRAMAQSHGDARKAWQAVDHTLRRLFVSALQSDLFNRVLAPRIDGIDRLELGDIAYKHVNGACFRVEDVGREQPRCDAFEISPTGPLFGRRMTEAGGPPGELEAQILKQIGLRQEQIHVAAAGKITGARRPLRIPLREWSVESGADGHGAYLAVGFFLPAGAYATSVLREVCKSDAHRGEPQASAPAEAALAIDPSLADIHD
jgi:tRNA pseudouridine13 synthase